MLEQRRVVQITSTDGIATGARLADGGRVRAPATILATGGAAALWARTTNPTGAIGGGLLLAHYAGADLADLELMQFHPTAVVGENGADGFLVTEAVRGEGARLLNAAGERFVNELAPRDEVARAVAQLLQSTGARSVGLDMRDVDPALFPNVVSALRRAGIDPERELVPVAPAAHYMMGGIATDLHGQTSLPGLFAVGECSCTGLHGANRLASNSLTECFVFGARAAQAALAAPAAGPAAAPPTMLPLHPAPSSPTATRRALWELAGLERSGDGLRALAADPHPLARPDRGRGARARGEPRRSSAHRLPVHRSRPGRRACDARRHGRPRLENWT